MDTEAYLPVRILDMWPLYKAMASYTSGLPTIRLGYMYKCVCWDLKSWECYDGGKRILALIEMVRHIARATN